MAGNSSFRLAKTSLIYQGKEFFKNSTLHGVRYIAEEGRPFFDKFLWLCCTATGTTTTIIIIVSLWEKFQTNPTITGLDTDFHNWDVQFPALSFCQSQPVDLSRVESLIKKNFSGLTTDKDALTDYIVRVGSLSHETVQDLPDISNYPDFPRTALKEIAKEVVYRCEKLISECLWKEDERDCCANTFYPTFSENGFCYVFNSQSEQHVWNDENPQIKQEFAYETDLKWAFRLQMENISTNPVYIHSSNQQPTFDLKSQHLWDGSVSTIAFSVKTTYTTSDARQLSIKQRRCVFPDEIRLLTQENYTYIACMRECRVKKIATLCKCVPFIYKTIPGFHECDYDGLLCFRKYSDQIFHNSDCYCDLPCENTVYDVEKLTSEKFGSLEVGFVSWPMIRYKREVLFGWVDLLVSFGGIAGLFLGFSLLSGIEIIYFFTLRVCCMISNEKKFLRKLEEKYQTEEKPAIDLSLTPHFSKPKEANQIHVIQPY